MNDFIQQIREQVQRIWENLPTQQRILFIAAPVLLLIAMGVAVYLAGRPQMVTLVSSDNAAQLDKVISYLDTQGIKYDLPNARTIRVSQKDRYRITMRLGGEGLFGPSFGPGFEQLNKFQLGMTDRMLTIQEKVALQNELARMITEGAPDISNTIVQLVIPDEQLLFAKDRIEPSASVKIMTRGDISSRDVKGIQRLVAYSVKRLRPERVMVLDGSNRPLSEDSDSEPGAAQASKHIDIQHAIENDLQTKVEKHLEAIVGSGNYKVTVRAMLDWTEKKSENLHYDKEGQIELSTKSFSESTTTGGSSGGAPGVFANTQQDTGAGAGSEASKTETTEDINNYQYPWMKTLINEPIGEVKEISVAVLINHRLNETTKKMEPFPDEELLKIEKNLRVSVGLPETQTPGDPHKFNLTQLAFDTTQVRIQAKNEFWDTIMSVVRTVVPMILLFVLGYIVYLFFQKTFTAQERKLVGEEIPIEPVTEGKELSLAQLGLAEFGDMANLPAEEQRRLKMQEHVVSFASEKPEEVAAIIKSWLSG